MWEYYVITELRIIFQDKNNKIQDKNFCIHKETKHFIGYDGDFDSDESGYEDARDLFYKKQLKKYDKIIILYNNGHFIKADYEKKYKDKDLPELTLKILPKNETTIRIHGSRDYFRIKIKDGLYFEVVPVKKINNPNETISNFFLHTHVCFKVQMAQQAIQHQQHFLELQSRLHLLQKVYYCLF
jgi:hypothetical protein